MGLDRPNVINASFPRLMHYISAPYVRTLHARPEYGRMLGSLSISLADHPDSRGPQQWSYQCRTDLVHFQRRARGFWFGMAESARFREGLELALFYTTPDATACMILLACPNIKTLEILGIGVEEEPRLVGSLVAHLLEIGTAQTSEPEHDPDAQVSDVSPSEDRVLTRPILAELLKMETARTPESEPGPEPGPQVSDMSSSESRVPTQLPGLTKTLILQRVQNLTLGLGGKRLTLAQARAIFSLPNLRALRINRLFAINGLPFKARDVALDWRLCTHLEEFVLHKTLLSGTHIAKLLRLCPKLTKFEASWPPAADHEHEQHETTFQEIGTAISKHTPLMTSLNLQDWSQEGHGDRFIIPQSTRLKHTLREMQHLAHVTLCGDSLWCHPSYNVDAINDNLPSCIETLYFDEWDPLPDSLPTDDNSLDEDASFDAACDTNFTHVDDDESRCRTRDIRRLLLDERLHRLRRVVFREKDASDGEIKRRDPHVLRHIWTAAVRRRGWKLLENLTPPTNGIRYKLRWNPVNLSQPVPAWMLGNGTQLLHEAVLYRDLADE
jgi:hypothetical protein